MKPFVVQAATPLGEAIATLQDPQAHCLLVADAGGTLRGVFTEEDVLNKILGRPLPAGLTVGDFTEKEAYSIGEEATVGEALDMMGEKRLKYLPVCNRKRHPVGVLSVRWLMDFIADAFPANGAIPSEPDGVLEKDLTTVIRLPMSFVLTSQGHLDCLKLSHDEAIAAASLRFKGADHGAALVFEDGTLAGLLRVRDIPFKVLHRDHSAEHLPVMDFMTKVPESVRESETLQAAIHKIAKTGILFLVYSAGENYGLVSARDIVAYIYSHIHDDE